jgi:hypothetical protein
MVRNDGCIYFEGPIPHWCQSLFLVAPPKNIDATFGIGDVVQTHFSNTYHVDKVDQRHCL